RAAPPSRKLISGGSGIRKAGLEYEEMGPARPLGRRPLRPRTRAYVNCVRIQWQVRSYQHQCTGSHQNSAVKRAWARVVLGWVTSWEVLVLHLFFGASFFACSSGLPRARGTPSRKLISGGSGIRKAGLQYDEMGPARPLGRRPLRPRTRAYVNCVRIQWQVRSYQHQCTGSHQNSAVKRAWARVVLGWVTSWEVLVLHLFFGASFFACSSGLPRARGTLSRKLISGGSGIRKAGLQYEEMGPARPLGRRPL
ncbi:hypothetical protein PIB30_110595, partial [Stylosanthes scabra]|nr:hypothetical protein [Stylosanthes scabra]